MKLRRKKMKVYQLVAEEDEPPKVVLELEVEPLLEVESDLEPALGGLAPLDEAVFLQVHDQRGQVDQAGHRKVEHVVIPDKEGD